MIGLGYVGLPVAHAFAKKFEGVIGFDVAEKRISELKVGKDSTGELTADHVLGLFRIAHAHGESQPVGEVEGALAEQRPGFRLELVKVVAGDLVRAVGAVCLHGEQALRQRLRAE